MTVDRFRFEPKCPGYDEKVVWIIPRLKAQLDSFDFPHEDIWVEVMFYELMVRATDVIPSGNMRRLIRERLRIQNRLPPREPVLAKWEARKISRATSAALARNTKSRL